MTPTIEELARGLTEAQKRAVMEASDMMSNHGGYPLMTVAVTSDPWPAGIAQFLTLKSDRLTPLGLTLRAYLEKTHGG
ncbi:MAG: hypothetical protein ACLGIM_04415 [Alphaproteobacteria bacterium]